MVSYILDFLQFIVDFIFGILPRKAPSIDDYAKAKVIVHRGWVSREIKENTLEAFRMCVGKGLFGIEFDVRWTKDLVPVIHHDISLKRVFESDEVLRDLSFSDLRSRFPEIPTLEEVVKEFGKKIHLLIEIKQEHFPDLQKQNDILRTVLSTLEEGEDYHILSLHKRNFDAFNFFKTSTMILVSTKNPKEISQQVIDNNYGGFMGHYFLLGDSLLRSHRNRLLGTGFPKNENTFKREINRSQIDWIFTNHPEVFLKYREKRLFRVSLNSRL